ncbi:nucleotide exchange factor GrpE [Candidatus Poribacteria bacterium]|nr:nucleotide exchange factor GrpE [Candidatus Poribacteria bacterium]
MSHGHNNNSNKKDSEINIAVNAENPKNSTENSNIDKNADINVFEEIIKTLEKSNSEKDEQITQHKEQVLRLHAEFDNFRKRSLREKTEFCKYSLEKLMLDILPVLDNFDSALKAIPQIEQNQSTKSFIEGINMSYKSLKNVLEKEGLKEINSCGQNFDPAIHDAVQIIECSDHPDAHVIDELQKGYSLGEKIIRHPKVKVSKNQSSEQS